MPATSIIGSPAGMEVGVWVGSKVGTDVGAELLVYWSGANVMNPRWFHGVVNYYNAEKGQHYVIYEEDNDMQWHDLRTTRYRLLKRA